MSFKSKNTYVKRFYYEAGQTQVYKPPRANLFTEFDLDINLEVDIATSASSNAPDYQIARAIQKLEVRTSDGNVKWSMSGEALAVKFLYRRGVEAKSNASIAGATGNNKQGRMFLKCLFSPDNAARPQDYMMDTRAQEYEIAVTWRDLTVAGTLFGTIAGTMAAAQGENYIDLTLHKVDLSPSPNGTKDAYATQSPFIRGLREVIEDVTSTQDGFLIQPSKMKQYRGFTLWATHEANTSQEIGINTILTDKIVLQDTQDTQYHSVKARSLHEETSLARGLGSGLPDGIYDMDLTRFGNLVDEIASDNVVELKLLPDVTKLANATRIHMIYDTTERQ